MNFPTTLLQINWHNLKNYKLLRVKIWAVKFGLGHSATILNRKHIKAIQGGFNIFNKKWTDWKG